MTSNGLAFGHPSADALLLYALAPEFCEFAPLRSEDRIHRLALGQLVDQLVESADFAGQRWIVIPAKAETQQLVAQNFHDLRANKSLPRFPTALVPKLDLLGDRSVSEHMIASAMTQYQIFYSVRPVMTLRK